MAISQFINLISGAHRLAKLDPTTAFPGQEITPDQLQYHCVLIRAGKIGAFAGLIFGIWSGYEMYLHPDTPTPDGRTIMMSFIVAPLMMVAAGMLGGMSWAGIFVPSLFFKGPIGTHWMKFSGAKGPASARFVAAITALLATGLLVFMMICSWLGKI